MFRYSVTQTGGQVASRGLQVQTLFSLLYAIKNSKELVSLTLEPNLDHEKFDFLVESTSGRSAFQVKSTQNQFSSKQIQSWAEELILAHEQDGAVGTTLTLVLAGKCTAEASRIRGYQEVSISIVDANEFDLIKQIAFDLEVILEQSGRVLPKKAEMIERTESLLWKIFSRSAYGFTWTKTELLDNLFNFLSESPKPKFWPLLQSPAGASVQVPREAVMENIQEVFLRDPEHNRMSCFLIAVKGHGKTTCAIQYGRHFQEELLWLNAAQVTEQEQALQEITDFQGTIVLENLDAIPTRSSLKAQQWIGQLTGKILVLTSRQDYATCLAEMWGCARSLRWRTVKLAGLTLEEVRSLSEGRIQAQVYAQLEDKLGMLNNWMCGSPFFWTFVFDSYDNDEETFLNLINRLIPVSDKRPNGEEVKELHTKFFIEWLERLARPKWLNTEVSDPEQLIEQVEFLPWLKLVAMIYGGVSLIGVSPEFISETMGEPVENVRAAANHLLRIGFLKPVSYFDDALEPVDLLRQSMRECIQTEFYYLAQSYFEKSFYRLLSQDSISSRQGCSLVDAWLVSLETTFFKSGDQNTKLGLDSAYVQLSKDFESLNLKLTNSAFIPAENIAQAIVIGASRISCATVIGAARALGKLTKTSDLIAELMWEASLLHEDYLAKAETIRAAIHHWLGTGSKSKSDLAELLNHRWLELNVISKGDWCVNAALIGGYCSLRQEKEALAKLLNQRVIGRNNGLFVVMAHALKIGDQSLYFEAKRRLDAKGLNDGVLTCLRHGWARHFDKLPFVGNTRINPNNVLFHYAMAGNDDDFDDLVRCFETAKIHSPTDITVHFRA